ncbi:GNAT family N-acetyltransferase [Cellulosilyticum ruminicola]|uniref:GNAT family N-acetyltransferase n=1 Tax=Cellulosilyticum ruminicola TaxID=425254 RepID=UPI0006CFD5A5|nr:GNAT family N-acetyltransferase [Cellulosilyticum ruminicola]
MNHTLNAKRKDGNTTTLTLKSLTLEHVKQILDLQAEIIASIEDPQIYFASTHDEIMHHIENHQILFGYFTPENELISLMVYLRLGLDSSNYGYDLNLPKEKLLAIGQIDTVLVKPDFRGNKIQYLMCKYVEEIAKQTGITMLCATASPYNPFSVNNFLSLGYEVRMDKLKYGGLRRYVLAKDL